MAKKGAAGAGQQPEGDGDDGGPVVLLPVAMNTLCAECGGKVDTVVSPWQVVGNGTFKCIDCRCKAIKEKARGDVSDLKSKADKVREDARQGTLPLK